MHTSGFRVGLILLLAVELILGLAPVMVLGAAIGWPVSLGFAADRILPLIHDHLADVRLGYGVYLAYSTLFIVVVAAMAVWSRQNKPWGLALRLAVALAALSTLARAVGILRWLTAIPGIADWYLGSSDPTAAVGVFNAVNSYGGAAGEALGIGLFGGGALAALAIGFLMERRRWLGWWTLAVAAIQLLNLAGLFGVDVGPATTMAALALLVWFVTAGITVLVPQRPPLDP